MNWFADWKQWEAKAVFALLHLRKKGGIDLEHSVRERPVWVKNDPVKFTFVQKPACCECFRPWSQYEFLDVSVMMCKPPVPTVQTNPLLLKWRCQAQEYHPPGAC